MTRRAILLAFCSILNIAGLYLIFFLGRSVGGVLHIAGFTLPIASLQGIISAVTMFLCILLVFIDYNWGGKISVFLIIASIGVSVAQIFRSHALYSLPGIISSGVSLFSITLIYFFYKRRTLNSYTDLITGLKNRRKFAEELNDKILSKKPFCLACVEIEGFKQINDSYGLQIGDFVLQKTAERLTRTLGDRDKLFKITGAVFVIFFDSEIVSQDVLLELITPEKVQLPIQTDEPDSPLASVSVSLVAGIAQYPEDASCANVLLTHADTALNAAKKSENKKIYFYTTDLEAAEIKQREAENLIHKSLEHDWFYLVYQPQFTLAERKLRGFETLIRCKLPDGTFVSPGEFIPAAEKSNLILKIDDYVLRRAMQEFKPVLEEKGENYIVSVNVSAKNMGMTDFADRVKTIISEVQFPPHCLEIEITEYSLAESIETTIANINKLHEIGVQVALDDFGTGYTSIAQLMNLPINLLKIDKSLIDNIESNQNIRDLVDSVIYMGHVMNCEVISEGVENEQQIVVLKEHNCDFVQGFVWGKPLPYKEAVNLC